MNNKLGRPKEFDEEEAVGIAMDLFWTNGYEKTSLDDLIKAMKLSKSSFYQTFKSKKELFKRSLGFYFNSNCSMVSKMQSQYSSKEILEAFIQKQLEEFKQFGHVRGCLLMNSGAECYTKYPEMVPVISGYYDEAILKYTALVLDAQAQGDMQNTMEARKIAILFYSSLTGMANVIKAGAPKEVVQVVVDEIEKLIS